MSKDFELRLIRVKWESEGEHDASQTWVSADEIPLETEDGICYMGAITSHPRFDINGNPNDAQLAVRSTIKIPGEPPEFACGAGSYDKITTVMDTEGVNWWVEKHSWEDKEYWSARSHTTAGMVTIKVGNQTIKLEIYPQFPNAKAQYEQMRQDFLDGLGRLILDEKSPVMAEISRCTQLRTDASFDDDKFGGSLPDGSPVGPTRYRDFVQALDAVSSRLRTQLRRRPGLVPAYQAQRDVTALRQFAIRQNARHVKGFVSEEHPDTPENRYLLWMAQDVIKQMKREESIFHNQQERWHCEAEEKRAQCDRLTSMKVSGKDKYEDNKRDLEILNKASKQAELNSERLKRVRLAIEQYRRSIERLCDGDWHSLRTSHVLPKSSVFSRDARYSRVLRLYRNLKHVGESSRGCQEKLEQLRSLELNGIAEWNELYERWCLLRILTTLTLDFGFVAAPDDWRSDLMDAYINRKKSQKASGYNYRCSMIKGERRVEVYWERKLDVHGSKGSKLPDFTLLLYRIDQGTEELMATVVMDAKSYPYEHSVAGRDKWQDDLIWLTEPPESGKENKLRPYKGPNKNYLNKNPKAPDGTNHVYLLHCSQKVQDNQKPPHYIAPHFPSYYGETHYDVKKKGLSHRCGYVLATVAKPEPLKRLLYMCLQYLMETDQHRVTPNSARMLDPQPHLSQFCVGCGQDLPQPERKKVEGGGWKYKYICHRCNRHLRVNYCQNWDCRNRLYKLDEEWTYHSTELNNIYNIRCPRCGESYGKSGSIEELNALSRQQAI